MERLGSRVFEHRAPAIAVAVAVAWLVWWHVWTSSPGHSERYSGKADDTIFVSIASYRDSDCVNTLVSMFENADRPTRVFAGVCEQNEPDEGEVCLPARFRWHDQVRRVSLPSKEAKGPTYARYMCSLLFRDETYFLQLDSHMRFVKGWDTTAISMLGKCGSDKAVLTHYPLDVGTPKAKGKSPGVPVLCKSKYDPNTKLATFEAVTLPASSAPKPVPFTAGGFTMGPGCMVRDVPYDPQLPHLFQGEELLYSARLWTSGYDFFTPTRNLVYHHYYRKGSPKFWDDLDTEKVQKKTVRKVRRILDGKLPEYEYGMGTERTLDEYWKFARIKWDEKTFRSEATFCV